MAPVPDAPATAAQLPIAPAPRPIVLYGYSGETVFRSKYDGYFHHGELCPHLAVDRDDNLFVAGQLRVGHEPLAVIKLLPGQEDRPAWLPVEPVPPRAWRGAVDNTYVTGAYVGRVKTDGGGVAWVRNLADVWYPTLAASAGVPGFVIAAGTTFAPGREHDLTLAGARIPPGSFVAAFDAEGNARWARPVVSERPGDDVRIGRVLVAPSGDTVVVADEYGSSTKDRSRVRVQRFDPRGAVLWTKHYQGSLSNSVAYPYRGEGGEGDQFGALDGEALYLWFYPCADEEDCSAVVVRLDARGEEQWRTVVVDAPRIYKSVVGAPHLAIGAGGDLYALVAYRHDVWVAGDHYNWSSGMSMGAGALFLSVTAAGKPAFHRDLESDRHGVFVDGLAAGRGGRMWLLGTFWRYVNFDSDAQAPRRPLELVSPPGDDEESYGPAFLAAFDRDGRGLEAFPLAFGYSVATATGRDGALYLTERYHGDLMLDGLRDGYRYKHYGCAIVKLP